MKNRAKVRKWSLVLGLVFLITTIVKSQEVWELEKCIEHAITNNIQLRKSAIYMTDALVVQKMDNHQRLPSLSGKTKLASEFGKSIDPTTNQFVNRNILSTNFGINADLIVYNGGRLNNRIKKGTIDRQFLEADKEYITDKIVLDVITAYFQVLLYKENYTNINVQLASINNQITLLEKLVQEGSRAAYEVIDLRAEYAQTEQRLLLAEDSIAESMLQFKGIMNVDRGMNIALKLPNELTYDHTESDSLSVDVLIEQILPQVSELRAHNLLIRSGDLEVAIEKGLGKPVVSLSSFVNTNFSNQSKSEEGSIAILNESSVLIDGRRSTLGMEEILPGQFRTMPYFNQLDDNISFGINVNMKIPIFDNYVSKGSVERAQLRVEILKANNEELELDIKDELLQYWNDAKAAQRSLIASDKLLSARKLAFDQAERRFQLGAISSYDFINLQEKLNIASANRIIAKYAFLMKMEIWDYWSD